MLAHFLLAGAAISAGVHGLHNHQHRPSLNFGPSTPRKLTASILDTSSSPLVAFNAASSFKATSGNRSRDNGAVIAQAFLEHLHPEQQFRLQSESQSAGDSVHHAYFVQTVGGRDVIDGLVNINVDTTTGQIISYGDSTFVPTVPCKSGSAPLLNQMVFGVSSGEAEQNLCTGSAKEVVDINAAPIDPRLAMANFVLQAAPGFLAEHASLDDLLNTMSVSHSITGEDASIKLLNVPGAVEDVPAKLSYIQREDGSLALTWSFEYQMNDSWYEAHISAAQDASDAAVPLMVVDWVRDAPSSKPSKPVPELEYSYKVFPWGVNDPSEGKREVVTCPADKAASPLGWHQIAVGAGRESGRKGQKIIKPESRDDDDLSAPGWSRDLSHGALFTDTRGNNVYAQDNPSGGSTFENNFRPHHDATGAFNYKLAWGKHPEGKHIDPKSYINASITELFYTINELHDLTHHYGFDEASGNFQSHNFGKGGLGGDPVIAMAQDGSGTNNANFATPPDGQSGRMRMYYWDAAEPYSDGDLEAGIVTHEYTHGISTRLVGGPANSGCLGWGESGGMGEGYGDFLATLIRMKDGKVHDFDMGAWAAHRAGGIRPHPYSTNQTVNPDTYKTLDRPGYFGVHAIGSVYAEYLFEVAEALIAKHGWTKSLFPPPVESAAHDDFFVVNEKTGRKHPRHGNTYVLQLFIDAFKLCPCRPSFMNHRDAMLQADHVYTGGENACTIWKAYAKRGLGPDASLRGGTPWGGGIRTESYSIPKACIGRP